MPSLAPHSRPPLLRRIFRLHNFAPTRFPPVVPRYRLFPPGKAQLCFLVFLFGALGLAGCDTINGVRRTAPVHAVPDLPSIKARIESYPEALEVKFSEAKGSQPITLSGLKPAEEVFYLYYTNRKDVYGTLMFTRDYKGEASYRQTLLELNRLPPQRWIDATWPVMKRIERDLIEDFGLPEIRGAVKVEVIRVEDPERKTPHPAPASAPSGGAAQP